MDELTLMRSFRAERVKQNSAARAAAWRALEARFDSAPAAGASEGSARSGGLLFRHRRRLLAFAGAMVLAAAFASLLVFSSGPTAQPAAAVVLRQTAAVAAAAPGPSGIPGPGRFLYTKTKSLELQEWVPGSYTASFGGVVMKGPSRVPFHAFIPWQEEAWMSVDEADRRRLVMGTPHFLSSAEQRRWERAGSPLPSPFNRRGVRDGESRGGSGFRDYSRLPTEPKALRLAIERRQAAEPPPTGQVIAELWDILDKPNSTPEVRAAVFGALAEVPGIELDRSAADLVGRLGYALSHESSESSSYGEHQPGFRVEYIFDPESSAILGRREVFSDPEKLPWVGGIPAGTVRREVAYLRSGIVDSTRERPGWPDDGSNT